MNGPIGIAAFLRSHKSAILSDWATRHPRSASPATESGDAERALGAILDRIAEAIEDISAIRVLGEGDATRHAFERFKQGYTLSDVVRELTTLRDSVTDLWLRQRSPVDACELAGFHRAIDEAIIDTIEQYQRTEGRIEQALDRVSTLALKADDLDSFLQKLFDSLRELAPSVDTAAVLLKEGEKLVLKAAIGFDEGVPSTGSVDLGAGFVGKIAADRRPHAVSADGAPPEMANAGLMWKGVRALYGVPLFDDERLIGVAHMGSLKAPEFSEADKLLFASIAGRAASTIIQRQTREAARLREERQAAIAALGLDALSASDLDVVYERAVQTVTAKVGAGAALVLEADGSDIAVRCAAGEGTSSELSVLIDDPAVSGALALNQVVLLTSEDEGLDRSLLAKHFTAGASLALPIPAPTPNDQPQSAIVALCRGRRSFSQDDVNFVQSIANVVASAVVQRRIVDQLRATGEWLRLLVDNYPSPVYAKDLEGHYVFANSAYLQLIGYSMQELYGLTDRDLGLSQEAALEIDPRSLDAQIPIEHEETLTFGERRHTFLSVKFPLRDADGNTYALCTIATDITDRKRIERDRERLLQQLESAVKTRDHVLAVVSHDLKNSLGIVKLGSTLLEEMGVTHAGDPQVAATVDKIDRAANQMDRLIRDLLDVTSLQEGRLSVQAGVCRTNDLLEDALELHRDLARNKAIEIGARHMAENLQVCCDRERVLQVFSNLIGNALKFCRPGDNIELRALRTGEQVCFGVRDSGPGISVEDRAHIFDPYWSGARQLGKGSGLGLWIAKGIIEAHGGSIWLEPDCARGTLFSFTLPLKQ